jgi:hypothetical protein
MNPSCRCRFFRCRVAYTETNQFEQQDLGSEFLKYIKRNKIRALTPFTLACMLSMARIHRFEDTVSMPFAFRVWGGGVEVQGYEVFKRHTLAQHHPTLIRDSPFNSLISLGIGVIKVYYSISIQRCWKTGTISLAERWWVVFWHLYKSICLSFIKLETSRATWAVQGTYQRHDEYGHWKDHIGLGPSDAELGAVGCTASWLLGIIIAF